jgi:prolyl oligopeptidase
MVALQRQHGHDVSYYENVEGGHGAAADNEQIATIWALTLEFLWRKLVAGSSLVTPEGVEAEPVAQPAECKGTA